MLEWRRFVRCFGGGIGGDVCLELSCRGEHGKEKGSGEQRAFVESLREVYFP